MSIETKETKENSFIQQGRSAYADRGWPGEFPPEPDLPPEKRRLFMLGWEEARYDALDALYRGSPEERNLEFNLRCHPME